MKLTPQQCLNKWAGTELKIVFTGTTTCVLRRSKPSDQPLECKSTTKAGNRVITAEIEWRIVGLKDAREILAAIIRKRGDDNKMEV